MITWVASHGCQVGPREVDNLQWNSQSHACKGYWDAPCRPLTPFLALMWSLECFDVVIFLAPPTSCQLGTNNDTGDVSPPPPSWSNLHPCDIKIILVSYNFCVTSFHNLAFHLEPNAVNGLADPKHRQYPEASEDVGQNGAQPLQNTRLWGVTDDTCGDQRQAEILRDIRWEWVKWWCASQAKSWHRVNFITCNESGKGLVQSLTWVTSCYWWVGPCDTRCLIVCGGMELRTARTKVLHIHSLLVTNICHNKTAHKQFCFHSIGLSWLTTHTSAFSVDFCMYEIYVRNISFNDACAVNSRENRNWCREGATGTGQYSHQASTQGLCAL